jgi:hypothetical protein
MRGRSEKLEGRRRRTELVTCGSKERLLLPRQARDRNDKNRNFKNDITTVISMVYEYEFERKTSCFRRAILGRKGHRYCRKCRQDKGLILE